MCSPVMLLPELLPLLVSDILVSRLGWARLSSRWGHSVCTLYLYLCQNHAVVCPHRDAPEDLHLGHLHVA